MKIALFKFSIEGANMALSTTQINQAYIAILGRAAIGTESRVAGDASVSDVAASLIAAQANKGDKDIFANLADKALAESNGLNNSEFVESLYTTLLNRDTENDAEGKAFWLNALNNGASREDLIASFINAIIAQKAANTQDYQNYAAQVAVKSDDFVESLYTNLLGRSSDEAGKAYWSGLIADGVSFADVAASFAAAAFSQGKDTADGVTIANKLEVANYATTSITAFSKVATEENIKALEASIKQMITNTDKDSTAETIAEAKKAISSEANTFVSPGSVSFTRSDKDKLGVDANDEHNTTKATDFNGSLNLSDPTKGTIQANDKVYGNPEFADGNILTVNVTGTTTEKTLDLNNKLPTTISGVKNLEIKASTARVSGDISDKFTNTVTINAGYTSTEKPNASEITVKHKLGTYTAGAKADKLTVDSGASINNVDMGAGNDTISLKAGNGGNAAAKVIKINAGDGTDTLELATVASANIGDSGDYTKIEKITGVEVIKLTGATEATSGAQISYDAIKDTNAAFNLSSDKAGSGDLTIKVGDNKNIDVSKITNGVYDKDKDTLENKVATLTISDVKADATIKLGSAVDGNKLNDVIKLDANAANVTITNVGSGDKLELKAIGDLSSITGSATMYSSASSISNNNIKFVNNKGTIDTVEKALAELNSGSFSNSTAKALIAFNDGNGKAYLYSAKGNTVDSSISSTDQLKLIAIVDNNIDTNDKADAAGILTFA